MRRRRAAIVLVALALLGTACSGDNKKESSGTVEEEMEDAPLVGPQTYTVGIDAPSPEGKNIQSSVFLPPSVKVRPGDTIVFENLSTQAPHTVTFGAASKPEEALSPATKAGLANPVVFGPCYTTAAPAAGTEACPEAPPPSPPPYVGKGFWNSGVVAPAAPSGTPSRVAVNVASETAPGSYGYSCLLHPNMGGVIDVVEEDSLRKPPADVARQGRRHRSAVLSTAERIAEPSPPPASGPSVTAGWGDNMIAVNRFSPPVVNITAGQSVTWRTANPAEPHTVTFESPFKAPEDHGVFTPGGAKTGARYAGGFAHSGLMGPKPFPAETFSLVFTKPGTYHYVCVLHPGMAGQVEVTN